MLTDMAIAVAFWTGDKLQRLARLVGSPAWRLQSWAFTKANERGWTRRYICKTYR